MKTKSAFIPVILISLIFSFGKVQAQSSLMGVESGWGNWKASTGNFTSGGGVAITATGLTPTAPRFNITSGTGKDGCTPGAAPGSPIIPVVAPGFGNASIQLGQPKTPSGCTGGCVEQLTYTFTPTPQDSELIFSYALIIEEPGHAPADQPFVSFLLTAPNGDTVPCGYFRYSAGPSTPGFFTASNCGISISYYKPWTTFGVNFANYVGITLKLVLTNSDCSLGGHFAHSYWDFSGNIKPKCCFGQPLTLCVPDNPAAPNTYQWVHNGNPMSSIASCITVTPQQGDTFAVNVIAPSGCKFYPIFVPQDTCLTGIGENKAEQSLFVSPNPSDGRFLIEWNGIITEVEIFNAFGKKIERQTTHSPREVDISHQPAGIYFIRVNTSLGILARKVVLQK